MQTPYAIFLPCILTVFIWVYWIPKPIVYQKLLLGFGSFIGLLWMSPVMAVALGLMTLLVHRGCHIADRFHFFSRSIRAILIHIQISFFLVYLMTGFDFATPVARQLGQLSGIDWTWFSTNYFASFGVALVTLQIISYIIDCQKDKDSARGGFLDFFVYVFFLPKVLVGPIARASPWLPQVINPVMPRPNAVVQGLFLIVWGIYKKFLVADHLAVYTDRFFWQPGVMAPAGHVVLTVLCAMAEFYCNFSGYSDLGRGFSRLLGFELPSDFKRPFLAYSPQTFYQRWHISLSEWFREYLVFPLWLRFKHWPLHSFIFIGFLLLSSVMMAICYKLSINIIILGMLHGGLWSIYHCGKKIFAKSSFASGLVCRGLTSIFWFIALYISTILLKSFNFDIARIIISGHLNPWQIQDPGLWLSLLLFFGPVIAVEWIQEKGGEMFFERWPRAHYFLLVFALWLGIFLTTSLPWKSFELVRL